MDSEITVLKFLLGRKEEGFTIRKISESLKINYRIAYETAMSLEKDGLIKIIKHGNSKICSLTYKFDWRVFKAEYLRRQDLFKNKDFLVIHDDLSKLKFPFVALLFGSYAKGTQTRHSDMDILAIGGDEKEITSNLMLLFSEKVHLTWVTYEDFITMAKSREFTAVSEAIKNNIILVGIEEYYRLLKNAGRV